MTRIQVTIVRSTPKAHLVQDTTGRTGWIQARWLAADSTVSATTFEKAVASAADRAASQQRKSDFEAAEKQFRNNWHLVEVAKETEKAVAAKITILAPGGFEEEALVWFPKSAIGGGENFAEIPGWMIRDREGSVGDNFRPSGSYQAHRMCKGEVAHTLRGVQVLATFIA